MHPTTFTCALFKVPRNLFDKLSITYACGYVSKRWFFAHVVAKNKGGVCSKWIHRAFAYPHAEKLRARRSRACIAPVAREMSDVCDVKDLFSFREPDAGHPRETNCCLDLLCTLHISISLFRFSLFFISPYFVLRSRTVITSRVLY